MNRIEQASTSAMEDTIRRLAIGLVALAAQAAATEAVAQGAYAAGSAGRSSWAYPCGQTDCQRNSTAWRIAGGYRFNRVVALEGFYADLGRSRSSNYQFDGSLGAAGVGVETLLGWQFSQVELAAKIGLAAMRNDFRAASTSSYQSSRTRRTELVGGLMGAWRATPTVAIRLDVDIVTVALDGDAVFYSRGSDVTTVFLGLQFGF